MKQAQSNLNSVEKALRILLFFQPDHPVRGVRELSTHLGFSPATTQRLLQTLKSYGFVEQDPQTRQYYLGNIYYQFIQTLQSQQPITRAALPYMQQLLSSTRETVHLNIVQGMERICIDTLESPRNLKAGMPIGNRSPLYAGASSKCLLAFSTEDFIDDYLETIQFTPLTGDTITDSIRLRAELQTIRAQGFALSLGERSEGLGSLSAPVTDFRGLIIAAVSLALPEIRYKDDRHREFCLGELIRNAKAISIRMGKRNHDDS
jgi:IclR family transcriptional regulator, KDG regulon repressor